ncbi:MAG: polysaccharide lyase, partial [Planctomycetota bacterium]
RIATYLYDQNKEKKWGIGQTTEKSVFTPGEWHAVMLKVALNTPGKADGSARVLVDGNEVLHTGNVEFRGKGGDETLIQQFLFSTFHGGNKPRWAPKDKDGKYRKVYALFDNFLVVEGAD